MKVGGSLAELSFFNLWDLRIDGIVIESVGHLVDVGELLVWGNFPIYRHVQKCQSVLCELISVTQTCPTL